MVGKTQAAQAAGQPPAAPEEQLGASIVTPPEGPQDASDPANGQQLGASTVTPPQGQQDTATGEQLGASTVTQPEGQQDAASENTQAGQQNAASAHVQIGQQDAASGNDTPALPPVGPHPLQPGCIVLGIATKYKDKFNGVKCKVLALRSNKVNVEILEGPAKGTTHPYVYNSFTHVCPGLQSASAPPANTGAAVSSTGAGSSGDAPGAASASTGSSGDAPGPAPAAPVLVETDPVAELADEPILDVGALWGSQS